MRKIKTLTLIVCLLILISIETKSQYKVVANTSTSSSVVLNLQYTGKDHFYIKKTSPIIKDLVFIFQMHSFNDFYFKITDINQTRYQIPQVNPFTVDPLKNSTFSINLSAITFQYKQQPFDFRILRKSTQAVLFSTYQRNIIFSEYYIQIGTEVDSSYIYGLGQRFSSNFRKTTGKWTIFNRDRPQQIDYGTGRQTYGFYPVYLLRQRQNYFHYNYFRNSNAMDILINNTHDNRTFVTYKTIGGVIDFRFLIGQSDPEALLQKWNLYLGASALPPFWSLGFHQCRWGYKHVSDLQTVLKKYQQNDLPLDTIWSDIDYMTKFEDFTIDQNRFPLERMKQILKNYYYIPIIDAGVMVSNGTPYVTGKQRDVFVKTPNGHQLGGIVWPGATTFVDFHHPNATQYWIDMLDYLYKKVQFSGVWLDMNQFSNFCNGVCPNTQTTAGGFDYTHDLPYSPSFQGNIQISTIPLNSTHYGNITQANVHAFNGMLQTYNTNLFLKGKNKRPFIISRSSTLGTNKYGFHWTGDNYADFQFLRASIADNFNFQLYGIQMVGADICGFGGNTNEQLCARWLQLGSLYTFSRDHNQNAGIPQQPYALGPNVLQCARTNLKLRYSILKYYYSIFIIQKGTGSIFKPLFMKYSNDQNAYVDDIANSQFMIGRDLLATPILYPKTNQRHIYLPQHKWYDLHTGKLYHKGNNTINNISLTAKVPLFLAQGGLIFYQDTTKVRQTKQLNNVFQLIAGLSTTFANGSIISIKDYNDDEKISACLSQGCEYFFKVSLIETETKSQVQISCTYNGGTNLNEQINISKIKLYNNGNVIEKSFVQYLVFKGTEKKVIDLTSSSEHTFSQASTNNLVTQ